MGSRGYELLINHNGSSILCNVQVLLFGENFTGLTFNSRSFLQMSDWQKCLQNKYYKMVKHAFRALAFYKAKEFHAIYSVKQVVQSIRLVVRSERMDKNVNLMRLA